MKEKTSIRVLLLSCQGGVVFLLSLLVVPKIASRIDL